MMVAMAAIQYTVAGINTISGAPLTARVDASPGAPTVRDVSIASVVSEGSDVGQVTVRFDRLDITSAAPASAPFTFDVWCTAHDSSGNELRVRDGDDRMASLADVDVNYDMTSGSAASRWRAVTDIHVEVTIR